MKKNQVIRRRETFWSKQNASGQFISRNQPVLSSRKDGLFFERIRKNNAHPKKQRTGETVKLQMAHIFNTSNRIRPGIFP